MRFNSFVLLIVFTSGFLALCQAASYIDAGAVDWFEQNCHPARNFSSTCKSVYTTANAKYPNNNPANFANYVDEVCPACVSDFEQIVPLNREKITNPFCILGSLTYNTLPLTCKQNSKGQYCYQSIAELKKLNLSLEQANIFPCAVFDCCLFDMMRLLGDAQVAPIISAISQRCSIPAENQVCKSKTFSSSLPSSPASTEQPALSSTEVGVISTVGVVGGLAAAAGLLFWIRKRNPRKPQDVYLNSTA
jgi:hypothetical protein